MKHPRTPAREGGYVLLLTLIALVVLLFGILFTTRGTLLQTAMTGNTVQQDKDVQVGDMALRQVQTAIYRWACNSSPHCDPLQTVAQGQPWFVFNPTWSGNQPTQSFWTSCGNGCALSNLLNAAQSTQLPPLPGNPNVQVVIQQLTGFPPRASACQAKSASGQSISGTVVTSNNAAGPPQPMYYQIFLRITEANGITSVSTNTPLELCP